MEMMRITRVVVLVLLSVAFRPAGAFSHAVENPSGEQIHEFVSDITIHADGSMTVTETITVAVEGNVFKRGIYRDFPTTYRDGPFIVRVPFNVVSVTRDGQPEPYLTERRSNGVRVYVGEEDVFLSHATYVYALTYTTDGQLGFFEDHDELYWNATGNDWSVPILHAEALVRLPEGIPAEAVGTTAFTGTFGEQGRDFITSAGRDGSASFSTTDALLPGEGFTVVVSWPKGHVAEPTILERWLVLLRANLGAGIGAFGVAGLLWYFLRSWHRVGRDPTKGTIVAQYEPEVTYKEGGNETLSPAGMRYILRMGEDDTAVAAAIVSMAVKGAVVIGEEKKFLKKRVYSVSRGKQEALDALTPEERALYDELLGTTRDTIRLEQKNYR